MVVAEGGGGRKSAREGETSGEDAGGGAGSEAEEGTEHRGGAGGGVKDGEDGWRSWLELRKVRWRCGKC